MKDPKVKRVKELKLQVEELEERIAPGLLTAGTSGGAPGLLTAATSGGAPGLLTAATSGGGC